MNITTRISKEKWLDIALDKLITKGPSALTIAMLCNQLKVTKGSFYHHFSNRDDFVEQLMAFWFQKTTLDFITEANKGKTPHEKLQRLDHVIAASNIDAERHIRAWALREPLIPPHLIQVDQQRLQYLSTCYQALGIDSEHANDIAILTYANFLGMLIMYPQPSHETALRISTLTSKSILGATQ